MKRRDKNKSLIPIVFYLGVSMLLIIGCRKECCNQIEVVDIPVVTTDSVTNITQSSALCGGTITSDGGDTITARGVCWSITQSPTIEDSITSDSTGVGSFSSSITNLTANTTYFIHAYATNSAGTGYGNQQTFSTLAAPTLPILTTDPLTNIAQTTATSGGNITSDGGSPVTARGVCWSTSPNPTTANNKTEDGSGTGAFVSNMTGLVAGTLYYIRAYATNTAGTGYGNEQNFTTLPNNTIPTVATATTSNPTQITFISGGDVTSDGGDPVTARGVCWSTVSGPTVSDPHTSDGTGTGSFTSQVSNLQPNTLYYIRAYATNGIGTAYGNEVSGITVANAAPCPSEPSFFYEGEEYHTVMIGAQCWMKENLKVGTRIDGSQEQTNNSDIEKYCYDDIVAYCSEYGGLYQWGEMVQYLNGASNTTTWNPSPTGNVKGICPSGWHLPTDIEWSILTTYLGGENVAGGMMKETGFVHWLPPNAGANNVSGFTALPAGTRNNTANFVGLGIDTRFWAVSGNWPADDLIIYLHYLNKTAGLGGEDKASGNSVRCVKN